MSLPAVRTAAPSVHAQTATLYRKGKPVVRMDAKSFATVHDRLSNPLKYLPCERTYYPNEFDRVAATQRKSSALFKGMFQALLAGHEKVAVRPSAESNHWDCHYCHLAERVEKALLQFAEVQLVKTWNGGVPTYGNAKTDRASMDGFPNLGKNK